MQFNYYFLKALSKELKANLIGKTSSFIFSQNKDELILCFDGESEFIVKANLSSETSLLSFPSSFARARKNSVDLFSEILSLTVTGIRQFLNERSFSIQFEKQYELLFKLHGRHSNVLLFKKDELVTIFKKNIEKDRQLKTQTLNRNIDQSNQAIIDLEFDLFKVFPTFDKITKNYLKSAGFYDCKIPETKLEMLNFLLDQLNDSNFYVLKGSPDLRLFKPAEDFELFTSPIEASNYLSRQFFSNHGFAKLKNKLLTQVNKEIKKRESYISQNERKLIEIENRRGYDELANILMANLHVKVHASVEEIELFDFYANEQIKIKLKPNLSLQHNAENLYRKAKNQSKEIEILKGNIGAKKKALVILQTRKSEIDAVQDIKALKIFEKPTSANTTATSTPFMEFNIDGFQIFAGKNAKNNDLLTQKFAKKDDLWLHARDVSGSHVIIRNPNGLSIPLHIIERVAQIAAWHSKRKSDTLCPVIYTPKKYVRKPKGALPGQVLLSKEQVVLVKPERHIS